MEELQVKTQERTGFCFTSLYRAFEKAVRSLGNPIDRFYQIGGYCVCLRFAGPALVRSIVPAFEHLAVQPICSPALTICLWDSLSTSISLPSHPDDAPMMLDRRRPTARSDSKHIYVFFQTVENVISALNINSNVGIFWTHDAARLPYYESAAPLRLILQPWLSAHRCHFVHAAAVGTDREGVLLAGRGGSGKSTTALTCLRSDLKYAGDDYCLVTAESDPYVYSIYNSGKVDANNTHRIPHLSSAITNATRLDREKALLFLHRHNPAQLSSGFRLRAILLPRPTGELDTTLAPAPPTAGLISLAPSTIFQLPSAGREVFQSLAALFKKVPCYYLETGTDLDQIPRVIVRLLSRQQDAATDSASSRGPTPSGPNRMTDGF